MKEYPIRIMDLKNLVQFQKYVFSNDLHGQIRQKNYVANIRCMLYLAMALPLDAASLCLEEGTQVKEDVIQNICRISA